MLSLEKDLGDVLFEKISLFFYERERRNEKRSIEQRKKRFIKNNTVVVMVNEKVIYDSTCNGEMTDELYNALISYGVADDIKPGRKRKNKVVYNLNPNITSIIPENYA